VKLGETHKSTSPSAVQVQNWPKTVNIEETLDVISWLEKGEWIFDICCNVKYTHISIPTVRKLYVC